MNFACVLCLLYIWNLCVIVLSYEPSIFLTFHSLFHYILPLMCRTDSGRVNILLMSSDRTMTNCLYIVFSGCYEMICVWLTKQTRCWFFFYCISDCLADSLIDMFVFGASTCEPYSLMAWLPQLSLHASSCCQHRSPNKPITNSPLLSLPWVRWPVSFPRGSWEFFPLLKLLVPHAYTER